MNVSIIDYGAKPDGTLCTAAIQSAIDACFLAGGGTVEVPAGTFLTGGIRLRSRITLRLKRGACLLGTRNPEDYSILADDTVEPVDPALLTDARWTPPRTRTSFDFLQKPGSPWNNALIRALYAEDVAIIGDEGSFIDGADCFDELGEELYRGPHGINMWYCRNVRFSGYTARNTGNWAHCINYSQNITVEDVTVLAGHDGVHFRSCDHITVDHCRFFTGDDCVAGFDNTDMTVTDCIMNTACSAFRLGGTHIRISDCVMYGPAKYLFRGSLTPEEKRSGVASAEVTTHRYNMLSAFTYFADHTREIRHQPGDIVIENCTVDHVDRFLHYNFSGNETWQNNRPLSDITFINVAARGLRHPLTAYGAADLPVRVTLEECTFEIAPDMDGMPFMQACHYENITLRDVEITGLQNAPLLLRWSSGDLTTDRLAYEDSANPLVKDADTPFQCKSI